MMRGADKGSFYNERFIRGLPFLAKTMKRIGGAKLVESNNINHEPDLWKISAEHPTPQELSRDSLDYMILSAVNRCVDEGGPKAKMSFVEIDCAHYQAASLHNIVNSRVPADGEAAPMATLSNWSFGFFSIRGERR